MCACVNGKHARYTKMERVIILLPVGSAEVETRLNVLLPCESQ